MIYLASIRSITSAVSRWHLSILAVPLCVLLVGCDSASSNADQEMMTKMASVEQNDLSNSLQSSDGSQSDSDNLDEVTEGQSLIAAAQFSNDAYKPSSATQSESKSSMLQATLMGDYGGMVPCIDCDSIDITLNLFADGSVLKSSSYHNTERPRKPLLESGIYRQDNDKITIVYENKNIEAYQIQDNHLVLLDKQDNPDNDYTLSRQ
ncbi:copper resistance protein NlpE N-terminal domain-containing protein [Psychrobacter sp. NG27]|uniref:copper resistance protein NlpE N-terminal domain-containing protein n=1 Tax=Psychrobacter sp. NG27 TaxID=2781966 RepID=UPI001D10626E|nr:copper resistance protein NlpE N-terminal domain-containing protein [Psychrobacter sp. NG27]